MVTPKNSIKACYCKVKKQAPSQTQTMTRLNLNTIRVVSNCQ